jgi:excisionase family DNA binding protein
MSADLAVALSVDDLHSLVRGALRAELGEQTKEKDILTRKEAAELLGLHPNVLVKYVRTRGLPAQKLGRDWRFSRRDLLEWMRTQPTASLKVVQR